MSMPLRDTLRDAITDELRRQSQLGRGLEVELQGPSTVRLKGPVNLDELIMVITGSVAGGP